MSEKSYKREVGSIVLASAALISWRYWTLEDAALITAYAGGYGTAMIALIPSGLSTFAIDHIWKDKAGVK